MDSLAVCITAANSITAVIKTACLPNSRSGKFVCIPLHTVVAVRTDFQKNSKTDTSKLGSVKCGDF